MNTTTLTGATPTLMYDHCQATQADDGTWSLLAYWSGDLRTIESDIDDLDIHRRCQEYDHEWSMSHRVAVRPVVQFVPEHDPREMGIHPDR
jgi:diadenosine tetraphosphatase ApaH/serine/threonine PP2A family protein phosphatase